MRRTSQTRPGPWLTIVLPLVCVVLSIAAYAAFGGALPLQPRGYRVHVPLPDAQNLVPGSDVRVAGVKIGKVTDIARDGRSASATIELQPRYEPLRAGASATVRTKTLLGEGYLELAPGPVNALPIADGGRLPADHVRPAVTLDEFLSTFSPGTRERMRRLFAGTASAFAGRGTSLNDTLGNGASFAVDLDSVAHTVGDQTRQLQQLFARSGDVLQALGRRTGALGNAITSADDLLAVTAGRNRDLAATMHALPAFLQALRHTSDAVTAASPELQRAIMALSPSVAPLGGVVDKTTSIAPQMRTALRTYARTTRIGQRGLPALTRIVNATPSATRGLYPATRQLIPFLNLLGTYHDQGLVGPIATASAAANGKLVGPGGKLYSHAGGLIYESNETVAGWVKRLPSDRSNPYPTPDWLLGIARKGFLTSFDCRHVQNPMYVPPLGSGVPPCMTQGPWTFNGKSAYYPRLTAAPR